MQGEQLVIVRPRTLESSIPSPRGRRSTCRASCSMDNSDAISLVVAVSRSSRSLRSPKLRKRRSRKKTHSCNSTMLSARRSKTSSLETMKPRPILAAVTSHVGPDAESPSSARRRAAHVIAKRNARLVFPSPGTIKARLCCDQYCATATSPVCGCFQPYS